jgi:thiol-disulfide isomerase/thioredoxin
MDQRKILWWLLLVVATYQTAFGQQLIEGRVVDKETGNPVPFASIGIVGTSKGTSSNLDGQFSLAVSGSFTLKVTCVGYQSMIVPSTEGIELIQLSPMATQLSEVVILSKTVNARRVVQKAFANIASNYDQQSFLQKFFYRHYCKDDAAYGRLIEAFVEVWKPRGYKPLRKAAGDREEIQVTQLRRSLDKTVAAQGHEPISVASVLQADIIGYQTAEKKAHLQFFEDVNNLRTDFENYIFSFDGITTYDGLEVYKINYRTRKDSLLTTSGYIAAPEATGSLHITTDSYTIIRTEDVRHDGSNVINTSAYYRMYEGKYYPYHFIREGENYLADQSRHTFHIELISVETEHPSTQPFTGHKPGKEELSKIPYDSVFWNNNTILKTTPLEDEIIHDLGGGKSLNAQFLLYRQYEWSTMNGGAEGEVKFNWFKNDSKGKRILYLGFWKSDCDLACILELEQTKRLQKLYRNKIAVVMLSLEDEEARWQQLLSKYNLFADGVINYRIDPNSALVKSYKITSTPSFILISKDGDVFDFNAKRPNDPLLEEDLKFLLEQGEQDTHQEPRE